jgi:hypothetical protein
MGRPARVRSVASVSHGRLVGLGDAEEHADHAHRHHRTELGDDVEPVGADERVEAAGAERPHLVLEGGHAARGEHARHQPAVRRVHRWVLEHDHPRRQLHAGLDDLEDVAAAVREALPVDERLLHVGVPRQRPEVVPLVVVDRRLVPQALVRRVGVGVDADVVGVVVDVPAGGGRHYAWLAMRPPSTGITAPVM